jgi:hypothetical protein
MYELLIDRSHTSRRLGCAYVFTGDVVSGKINR